MPLTLVPPAEPTPDERVRQRVKAMPKPDGMLQCNRCGCRCSLTTVSGSYVKNGRKRPGTVIDKDVCSECWKQGIWVSMLPELKNAT